MENLIKGIDVSRWQGTNIDWNKVKNAGFQFVFIKASESSAYKQAFIDGAKIQAAGAKDAGLKVGYYHFAKPSATPDIFSDAIAESNYFRNTLANGFVPADLPLVLDFEDSGNVLNNSDSEAWIQQFVGNITSDFSDVIIYSNSGFLNAQLPSSHSLGQMPLWIARYPKQVNLNISPLLPNGWSSFQIWQYSQTGKVDGIAGSVDLSVMKESFYNQF